MANKMELHRLIKGTTTSYSRYTIRHRAIPRISDGQKPIHRRIAFSMYMDGLRYDKYRLKSNPVAGAVLRYSPHGDASVYGAMVRLANDSVVYNIIDGKGAFSSITSRDVPAGGSRYCVTGDTLISTPKGLKYIDEIVSNSIENSDNVIDLKVHSKYNKVNTADMFFNSGKHKIKEINTVGNYNIKGSMNHPLLTISYNKINKKIEFVWKKIEDINIGDIIVFDSNKSISEKDIYSKDLMVFLGCMVSEGYISGDNQRYNRVGFGNSDYNYYDSFANSFRNEFPNIKYDEYESRLKSGKKYKEFNIHNSYFRNLMIKKYNFGMESSERCIPKQVFESSKFNQSIFLKYLFEGDGSVCSSIFSDNRNKGEGIIYSTSSHKLAKEIQHILLNSFGIYSGLFYSKSRNEYKVEIRTHKSINLYYENIGFVSDRKNNELKYIIDELNSRKSKYSKPSTDDSIPPFIHEYLVDNSLNSSSKYRRGFIGKEKLKNINYDDFNEDVIKTIDLLTNEYSDYIYLPVTKITDLDDEVVYSIRVDSDCHSFIGNGMINHNTEARLGYVAEELFGGINKNAVDFMLTYDEKREEPITLPASVPFILMNPNEGIASGIATKIPSFDLKDLRDNIELLLNGKEMNLMYPTFATGGMVLRDEEIAKQVELTGRGAYLLRAKYHIEENSIIITELPYGVTVESIADRIYDLKNKKDKDVADIVYINDDTDKNGLQFRIDAKKNTDKENLMKILYQKTQLQATFPCNLYTLDNNDNPKLWGTKNILLEWIKFRADVIKRIALFDIEKKKQRLNILMGLKSAVEELDKVIEIIKTSKEELVVENLMSTFNFNLEQAEFISELKLRQLNKTYIDKQTKSIKEIEKEIKNLEKLASTKKLIAQEILRGIDEAIKKHYIERRTEIVNHFDTQIDRKAIEEASDYNVRVIITKDGYIKKIPLTSLRGNFKIKFKDGDEVLTDIETLNSEEVLVFTNLYNVYKKKMSGIQDTKPSDLGTFMRNEISMDKEEYIISIVPLSEEIKDILIGFRDGKVAKISTEAYRTKTNRQILKNAFANKEVLFVKGISEDFDLMSVSSDTKTIIMNTSKVVSKASKTTQGVTFQKLKDGTMVDKYLLDLSDFSEEDIEYYTISNPGVGKYLK